MAENRGLINGLIAGAGGLVIAVILIFVVIATVQDADLLGADSTTAFAVINETGAELNVTGYTLATYNSSNSGFTITEMWGDDSGAYNISIPIANGTISTLGVLTNATEYVNGNVSVSYTYTYTYDNTYKASADNLAGNLTAGVDNVSTKIPTVLLIAAVVLLFGVLAILVIQAKKAGMMGGSGNSTL